MNTHLHTNWPIGAKVWFVREHEALTGRIADRSDGKNGLVYYVYVDSKNETLAVAPIDIIKWD